jgi:hypothetical protein
MDQEEKYSDSPDKEMTIFKAYSFLFKPKELESLNLSNSDLKSMLGKWLRLTAYILIFGLFVLFLMYQKLKKANSTDDLESATNGILATQLLMILSLIFLFIGISNLLKYLKS